MRYVITRTSVPRLAGFDTFFSDFFGDTSTAKIPPVDIFETDNAYTIEAEIAGYSENDVRVTLKDGILTISSEETWKERRAREKEAKNMIVSEIRLPEFSRSFKLPEDADAGNITADGRNGVLCIVIPRIRRVTPEKFEVRIGR